MHSASFPYPHQTRPENAQARPRSTLAQHINKPLRRRRWTSRNRVWSRHSIDHERVDFFDTRVTGRPEIWQTLRAALEVLWEADSAAVTQRQRAGLRETADGGGAQRARQDAGHNATIAATSGTATKSTETAETAEALATAQSMLDAAGITLPTSDLAQGAYDALGNFYAMPPWVVSDPTNIESDSTHELEVAKGRMGEGGFEDEEDEDENYFSSSNAEEDDGGDTDASNAKRKQQQHARQPSLRRRRVEKGKAVAVPTDQIAVRARLSATSRDIVIYLGREETVRSLVHRISEEGKVGYDNQHCRSSTLAFKYANHQFAAST